MTSLLQSRLKEFATQGNHQSVTKQLIQLAPKSLLAFTKSMNPGFRVNWHHRVFCQHLDRFVKGEITRLMIFVQPQTGKALAIDTPILTASGWKRADQIIVGDQIYGPDGRLTDVIACSEIWKNRELIRVRSDDGASVTVDREHLWTVRLDRARPTWQTYTTDYLSKRSSPRNPMIPKHGSIVRASADLPIPPYTLGVWLGDGHNAQAVISQADEDAPILRARIESEGFQTSNQKTRMTFGVLGLKKKLREQQLLGNKHIPEEYFVASEAQRLALLQGLIDTDGYVDPRTGLLEFCSMDRCLAEGVQRLVWSLGHKAYLNTGRATLNGVDHGEKYRVGFMLAGAAWLPRKALRCQNRTPQRSARYIRFEEAGRGDTVCLQVARPDGLFLAGKGYLVTHNSELVSRHLPAYILGNDPDHRIIAASYGDQFASEFNTDVQKIMDTERYRMIFPGVNLPRTGADRNWVRNTTRFDVVGRNGRYNCVGVGGSATGKTGHTLLIDDPVKNAKDVSAEGYRNDQWSWYKSVARARLRRDRFGTSPRVLLTMTRWHHDDLAGRLLAEAKANPNLPQWTVLCFPALREDMNDPLDPRQLDEPLWPQMVSRQDCEELKTDARTWASIYQQRPSPEHGVIVDRAWWRKWKELPPKFDKVIQSWDLTFDKTEKGSFVVGQVWGKIGPDRYLIHQYRERIGFTDQLKAVMTVTNNYPAAKAKVVEKKANGAALLNVLQNKIAGMIPQEVTGGSKENRAEAVAPQIRSGNVYIPDEKIYSWSSDFIEEWASFPLGKFNDQVDAASQALSFLDENVVKANFTIASIVGESRWAGMK